MLSISAFLGPQALAFFTGTAALTVVSTLGKDVAVRDLDAGVNTVTGVNNLGGTTVYGFNPAYNTPVNDTISTHLNRTVKTDLIRELPYKFDDNNNGTPPIIYNTKHNDVATPPPIFGETSPYQVQPQSPMNDSPLQVTTALSPPLILQQPQQPQQQQSLKYHGKPIASQEFTNLTGVQPQSPINVSPLQLTEEVKAAISPEPVLQQPSPPEPILLQQPQKQSLKYYGKPPTPQEYTNSTTPPISYPSDESWLSYLQINKFLEWLDSDETEEHFTNEVTVYGAGAVPMTPALLQLPQPEETFTNEVTLYTPLKKMGESTTREVTLYKAPRAPPPEEPWYTTLQNWIDDLVYWLRDVAPWGKDTVRQKTTKMQHQLAPPQSQYLLAPPALYDSPLQFPAEFKKRNDAATSQPIFRETSPYLLLPQYQLNAPPPPNGKQLPFKLSAAPQQHQIGIIYDDPMVPAVVPREINNVRGPKDMLVPNTTRLNQIRHKIREPYDSPLMPEPREQQKLIAPPLQLQKLPSHILNPPHMLNPPPPPPPLYESPLEFPKELRFIAPPDRHKYSRDHIKQRDKIKNEIKEYDKLIRDQTQEKYKKDTPLHRMQVLGKIIEFFQREKQAAQDVLSHHDTLRLNALPKQQLRITPQDKKELNDLLSGLSTLESIYDDRFIRDEEIEMMSNKTNSTEKAEIQTFLRYINDKKQEYIGKIYDWLDRYE